MDRAARDLVGLRRRGELRRAARLAGHAGSGGGADRAGGDRGAPWLDLERCRRLAASFHDRLPPVGTSPAPQMWASEVAVDDADALQRRLFDEHRIEVVVSAWEGKSLLRVSIAPYNQAADVERLLDALDGLGLLPS